VPNRPARKAKVKPVKTAAGEKTLELLQSSKARVIYSPEKGVPKFKPFPISGRLNSALNGDLGPDQKKIAQAGIALTETLLKKNRDYGSSAFESPVLAPDLASRKALLVRMSDKVKRIAQLQKTGTAEVQESLEDTIGDLAGYCLLWLTCPD
jgi:hypothetical protein